MFDTKYAIIEIADKQFMVKVGDTVKVYANPSIKTFSTLLIKDEDTLEIGTPVLDNGGVELTYTGDKKVKSTVRRYKGKSRYRVNKSHSDIYSVYVVNNIKMGAKNIINLEEKKPVKVEKTIKTEKTVKKPVKKAVVKSTKKTQTKKVVKEAK